MRCHPSLLVYLFLAILLALPACQPPGDGTTEAAADGDLDGEREAAEQEILRVPVRVKTMALEDVSPTTEASGSVQSDRDITIVSETSGQIVATELNIGKHVQKGDLLVSVDREPYVIAVNSAEAQLDQARVGLAAAKADYDRGKQLHETGDITQQMYDNLRFGFERAQAAEKAAEAGLANARRQLRKASIRAPFAGEIASKLVKLGDTIGPGTPIAQLVDRKGLKVTVGVGQQVIGAIKPGLPATVRIPTLSPEPFAATIVAIGPKALQPTMTYPVEVTLNDPPEAIRVGMVARVEIQVAETYQAMVLPLEVLHERYDQSFVYTIVAGTAKEVQLDLGPQLGRRVVIEAGLNPNDVVVIKGEARLKDGDPVEIVE